MCVDSIGTRLAKPDRYPQRLGSHQRKTCYNLTHSIVATIADKYRLNCSKSKDSGVSRPKKWWMETEAHAVAAPKISMLRALTTIASARAKRIV